MASIKSNVYSARQSNIVLVGAISFSSVSAPTGLGGSGHSVGCYVDTNNILHFIDSAGNDRQMHSSKWGTALTATSSIAATDSLVRCTCLGTAAINVTLPAPSTVGNGWKVTIKDSGGHAASGAIAIHPNGSENIDGANASATMSTNYGSKTFSTDGTDWFSLA